MRTDGWFPPSAPRLEVCPPVPPTAAAFPVRKPEREAPGSRARGPAMAPALFLGAGAAGPAGAGALPPALPGSGGCFAAVERGWCSGRGGLLLRRWCPRSPVCVPSPYTFPFFPPFLLESRCALSDVLRVRICRLSPSREVRAHLPVTVGFPAPRSVPGGRTASLVGGE